MRYQLETLACAVLGAVPFVWVWWGWSGTERTTAVVFALGLAVLRPWVRS